MKRLRKSNSNLDKRARCELAPNLIPLDEIEECIELKGRDELLDPDKYEKVSGSEYADTWTLGAVIANNTFQCCLVEYHEYKCIDENDPNFGKIVTAVASCGMNEETFSIENGFVHVSILNETAENIIQSKQLVGGVRIFQTQDLTNEEYVNTKADILQEIENGMNPRAALTSL